MKILLVDDSITMRRIIAKNLNNAGFDDLVEAGNGVEALKYVNDVDLILLDWNMPVMDGLSLVKEIRINQGNKTVPIIMVTSEGGKKEVLEALKNGVNDYVVKPFTPGILLSKINGIIGK